MLSAFLLGLSLLVGQKDVIVEPGTNPVPCKIHVIAVAQRILDSKSQKPFKVAVRISDYNLLSGDLVEIIGGPDPLMEFLRSNDLVQDGLDLNPDGSRFLYVIGTPQNLARLLSRQDIFWVGVRPPHSAKPLP